MSFPWPPLLFFTSGYVSGLILTLYRTTRSLPLPSTPPTSPSCDVSVHFITGIFDSSDLPYSTFSFGASGTSDLLFVVQWHHRISLGLCQGFRFMSLYRRYVAFAVMQPCRRGLMFRSGGHFSQFSGNASIIMDSGHL